jgi:hypothetical protein
MPRIRQSLSFALGAALLGFSGNAMAAVTSASFEINDAYTQWSSDELHIVPVAPHTMSNPSSCGNVDAYALDPSLTGHKERVSLAMGALLNGKTVQVVVDGCTSDDRPKVLTLIVYR